jgi:hypothetical protein
MKNYGPIFLALGGLWAGATVVSVYLLMHYSAGIPLEKVALYFMSVPTSLAVSLYFFGKGLHLTLIHSRKVSMSDLLRERIEDSF